MKLTQFAPLTALFAALSVSGAAMAGSSDDPKKLREWAEMRKEAVPASDILAGNVKNVANLVGRIEHLVLNEAKDDVQYVLFEVPDPYDYYTGGEDGYLNYDELDIDSSVAGGIDLIITDANVTSPAKTLKLTRSEVKGRMVSRLIGSDMHFADGSEREVEEMLIHPRSGKVTHYVVQMHPEALFNEEPRTVRAKDVTISEQGRIQTRLTLDKVRDQQVYDPAFL